MFTKTKTRQWSFETHSDAFAPSWFCINPLQPPPPAVETKTSTHDKFVHNWK